MIRCVLITTAMLLAHSTQAAAHQSLWDHPLIVELIHSRPATVDLGHDLPTLSRRLVAETRDGPWASRMENELELGLQADPVLTGYGTQHQVRCRATLCEVAIVSATGESDPEARKLAFGSFARLVDQDSELDHRTSAYLTVDEAPRRQSMLAFFARGKPPGPD